ncbi:hypothetical protein NFI96_006905 [Prochilodus magdalenae]|nr:hypothetical protein NFI96_006905 [Prochilodus magdalenae]
MLANAISKQQSHHPDAAVIIAGDFNQTDLKTVLSKFQHVSCPTRGENTPDHVYTNIKEAFSTTPLPRFSKRYHISLLMKPKYRQLLKRAQSSNAAMFHSTEDEPPLILAADEKSTITSMNDYRPIALTPIVMKCFESLILSHIKRSLPSTLDPHQFAYRANRSTDDAVSLAIHTALNHLDSTNSYVRMLFIDFSSAFNTIIPSRLIHKLSTLGISSPLCS